MKQIIKTLQAKRSLKEKIKQQQSNRSVQQKVLFSCKKLDLYGEPIYLSFKGSTKFQTMIGASVSFVVMILLLAYFSINLKSLVLTQIYNIDTVAETIDISDQVYDLKMTDFQFSFASTTEILPEYGKVELLQNYYIENSGQYIEQQKQISFDLCKVQQKQFTQVSTQFYCPSDSEVYSVGGTEFDKTNLNFISINVYKCIGIASNGKACKNDEQQKDYWRKNSFFLAVNNSYLDSADFDEPIHHFYDDKFYWFFTTEMESLSYIYMQFNKVVLKDDKVLGSSQKQNIIQVFNQVNSMRDQDPTSGLMLNLQFRLENIRQTYKRSVYSAIDLITECGALKTALFSVGFLLSSILNRKLAYASIIRRVYQIFDKEDEEARKNQQNQFQRSSKKPNGKKKTMEQRDKEVVKEDEEMKKFHQQKKPNIEQTLDKYNSREGFSQNYSMFAKLRQLVGETLQKNKKKIDVEDFMKSQKKRLYDYITDRNFLDYKTKDLFAYIFCGLCFRSKSNLKKNPKNRKHILFEKGQKKLNHELDVTTLIKSIRQLRLFSQVLLNENQRMLLKFQRSIIIESQSSSSCDSDIDDIDFQTLKEAKDTFVKEYFQDRLQNSLNTFESKSQHKMQMVDKRIIAGLIFRKVQTEQLVTHKDPQQDKQQQNEHFLQVNDGSHLNLTKKMTSPNDINIFQESGHFEPAQERKENDQPMNRVMSVDKLGRSHRKNQRPSTMSLTGKEAYSMLRSNL